MVGSRGIGMLLIGREMVVGKRVGEGERTCLGDRRRRRHIGRG